MQHAGYGGAARDIAAYKGGGGGQQYNGLDGQHELLYNIEFPLTVVLADMENCGFYVDRAALERYSMRLAGQDVYKRQVCSVTAY